MVVFKKAIPRRTFLRGMGATLALPMLDAMTPALTAETTRPIRMAFMQTPNGIFTLRTELTPKTWDAKRDHAASDGEPPTRHLRASFRRRGHRSEGAFGPQTGRPQYPRCHRLRRQADAHQGRRNGSRQDRPVSGGYPRCRAAHATGGEAG